MALQRWPDGPVIGIGIAEDCLCITVLDGDDVVRPETFGGLHGQLDGAALGERLRELQPALALLMTSPAAADGYESGMVLGTAIGLLAAIGVPVEHTALPLTSTAPAGQVLH